MVTTKNISFFLLLIIMLGSCKKNELQSKSKTILERINEYPELKKALHHYSAPKDSLKKKAMLFLINNMDAKKRLTTDADKKIVPFYKEMYQSGLSNTFDFKEKYDNRLVLDPISAYDLDANMITANELIENVDLAFEAYQFPWAKKVPFDDFCEFVLPHKIMDEPKSNWRKFYLGKNKKLIEYLLKNKIDDPLEVCRILNDSLISGYKFHEKFALPYPNLIDLNKNPIGQCLQRYLLYTATARSIGLPIAIDFTPQYGNYPGSHEWITLIQKKQFSFNAGEKWEPSGFRGVKYFRNVYSNSSNTAAKGPMSNPNVIDVSKEYVDRNIGNLTFGLKHMPSKDLYLFAFGIGKEFICLQKAKIVGKKAVFNNVSYCDSILFVGYYDGDTIVPIENPFMMFYWTKNISYLTPTKNIMRSVRLHRKYPKNGFVEDVFYNEVIGAKIQGSNFKDFKAPQDIFTFKEYPENTDKVEFNNKLNFNYYRYLPNATGQLNIAELHFIFDNDKAKPEEYYQFDSSSSDLNNLYDNNIETYFASSSKQNWIGIDRSKSQSKNIKAIKIIPRSTCNFIQIGDTYELFYFDFGWKSLGSKIAKDFHVDFENAPNNCLLLLRNLSQGSQERIFICEKLTDTDMTYAKQNFW